MPYNLAKELFYERSRMKANREKRELKVYGQSGYKYQDTPTIMLKGKWLEEAGFDIGQPIVNAP